MLIDINKIQVKDRIRKNFGDIEELANDIKENGLINPPVVTPEYELIAGERRLKALRMLEYKQIEVRVMAVNDAEHQLNLEISENEVRKDFSKLERLDYGRRLERIERVKAEQREKLGKKNPKENFPEGQDFGQTRDIVAEKIGIGSGKQYEKEKFIADNADLETLDAWNDGNISTHAAYIKIKTEKDAALDKIQELENTIKGYELRASVKNESNSKNSSNNKDDSQDVIDELIKEKSILETSKREEYEKAEGYKKKLEEMEKANKELDKQLKKKSKEIEELELRKDEILSRNDLNSEDTDNTDELDVQLDVFDFTSATSRFLKDTESFIKKGNSLWLADQEQVEQYNSQLDKMENFIEQFRMCLPEEDKKELSPKEEMARMFEIAKIHNEKMTAKRLKEQAAEKERELYGEDYGEM